MKELVMSVINISGQAAIIFVVLLMMRGIFALGRVPKKYAYGLWAILFIRLLLPIQLETCWGLMPQESGLTRAVESIVDGADWGGQDVRGNSERVVPYAGDQAVSGKWQSMFEGQKTPEEWQSMFEGQKTPEEWQSMFEGQGAPEEWQSMFEGQEAPEEWQNMFRGQEALEGRQSMFEGQETPEEWQSMFESQDISEERLSMLGGKNVPAKGRNISGEGQNAQLAQLRNEGRKVQNAFWGSSKIMVKRKGDAGFRQLSPWAVIVGIWITGSILLMGCGMFSYFRLKKGASCSIRLEGWKDGIYLADGIETPFVLGVLAPKIYLPSNMAGEHYPYVIAHERIHIRRRDYLFKLGAYLLTCLYWFHPLVWAGFMLMGRDMEMSCDEAVLRRMEGDCREEYADSLLQLSCGKHYPAAPLAVGEGDTRGRIKHIMGYRKTAAVVVVAAMVLTGILAAVLLASPQETAKEGQALQISSFSEENGALSPDSPPMELTEGNPTEASMEQPKDGVSGQDAETADGNREFAFQVAYRDVLFSTAPGMKGNTPLGADGAILDYADGDKVIFHGYFGLYVYSVSTGETIGTVDLQALGCGDTQGDNTCQVLVSRDGSKVYFYPLGGIREVESSDRKYPDSWHRLTLGGETVAAIKGLDQGEQGHVICSYVYDVASDRLRIASWNLEQSEDSYTEIEFSRLTGEELSKCRAVPVAEVEQNTGEQGFCSYHGMVFEKDGEQVFGYLKSASETLEDLVYVERPVEEKSPTDAQRPEYEENPADEQGPEYEKSPADEQRPEYEESPADAQRPEYGENPADMQKPDSVKAGSEWRKVIRLFGANGQGGSIVSYDERENAPRITIDGTTYDLGKVMTECRYGDGIMEYPFGNTSVNAIAELQCVDGFWIVEGHMNPKHSTYSFYDPVKGEWLCHMVGTCLTWSNQDEKPALWEGNSGSRISTVIYALDNKIYSLQDGLLAFIPLEQDKRGTASRPKEEICGLYRSGDEITVEIRSTQTEERRTVQFYDKGSGLGAEAIKLNNL